MNDKFYEALRAVDSIYGENYLSQIITIIEEKEIEFDILPFQPKGAIAVTITNKIVINKEMIDQLLTTNKKHLYFTFIFTLFHEMAHFIRIQKYGAEMDNDLNTSVFNIFFNRVKMEEDIANRYALRMFYKLVGRRCHEIDHMFRDLYNNKDAMTAIYMSMFMALRSTGKNYYDFINDFVIENNHVTK